MNRITDAFVIVGLVALGLPTANPPAMGQIFGWPGGSPPPFIQGPTLRDTLRNGCQAASDQARAAAQAAVDMGRRARFGSYQTQNFWNNFQNVQFQFQNLRSTFAATTAFVPQLQSPRASNAAAELEAGLNIIAEAFTPVQQEYQAGTLNRDTIVRMCQTLDEALELWRKELRKNSSRLGLIR